MLINLSNHPITTWSQPQQEAALKRYHRIEDLEFPKIDPKASFEDVKKFAEEFLWRIISLFEISQDEKNAVHVMGEFTFTYNLLALLKEHSVESVSSTTERSVIDTPTGKYSQFSFVGFRPYYRLQEVKI